MSYINAICSCETPQRGGLCLRMGFGLNTVYKAEYVAEVNADLCQGCRACCKLSVRCYKALVPFSKGLIDQTKCLGCGLGDRFQHDAIRLIPGGKIPVLRDKY